VSAAARSRVRAVAVRHPARGLTLLEVLVATAIAGLVVAAAFAWLWNVAALAGKADDKAQATTIASAVSRAIAADVRAATIVDDPPVGRDPACSLALAHDHVDVAPEAVLVVWDPSRAVVWRNAPGTYLADHVTRFDVSYRLADGRRLTGSEMASRDLSSVRVVRIELTVVVGSAVVRRATETTVGPA
jgi:prepilin-type N-terminal cleavage/methylation domain-containing protein